MDGHMLTPKLTRANALQALSSGTLFLPTLLKCHTYPSHSLGCPKGGAGGPQGAEQRKGS